MNKVVDERAYTILSRYFEETSPLSSNINSFNEFVDHTLQLIIEENKYIEPTIIPTNMMILRFDSIKSG